MHAQPNRLRPKVPKSATLLADELRRQVLVDRLPVGAELPSEPELIAQTGFSRGVVREALRLLEAEGLISIRRGPRGGVTVAHPDATNVTHSLALLLALSEATVRDLFTFRSLIEPAAAAMAAEHATDEQLAALRDVAQPPAGETPVAHNVEFHIAVAEASNNEFFRVSLIALHELTLWHSVDEGLGAETLHAAATAHVRIAEHILAGRATAAERAMRKHIAAFEEIMERDGRLDGPVIRPASWQRGVSAWPAATLTARRADRRP